MARDEDGELPEVGAWAEKKYALLLHYLTMFSTSMRKKWKTRIYIDLFSGAGRAAIKGTSRIVPTSALIALSLPFPFDRYVFCEENRSKMASLKARIAGVRSTADIRYVLGNCNDSIDQVLAELPPARIKDVLIACFVDPFGLNDLNFETIRRLADGRRIDFLVLIPSHMDATRNEGRLTLEAISTADEFLGNNSWRIRWDAVSRSAVSPTFGLFVVEEFARSMHELGYQRFDPRDAALVDANGRRLYHLALFSKSALGADFWRKAMKSESKQPGLFDE